MFGDKSLDALVAAILTFYKCVYDGVSDVVVSPFSRTDAIPQFAYGDTVIFLGVGISPGKIEHLVYDMGIKVVMVDHHDEFVEETGYTFLDWHNLPYFFLSETSEYDIFDRLDVFRPPEKVGWRFYFANNKVENKPVHIKRSTSGIVRDVILSNNPGFENFLSTFMRSDYATLIEQSQIHELWLHNGYERCGSYLVNQWFKYWYNENKDAFLNMKSNLLTPNDFFNQVRTSFFMTSFQEKVDFGHEQLMKTKVKTRELAMSDDVQRVEFRHVEIRDMKACYVKNPLISTLDESIVGNELVKEHGWDVVILDGPSRSDVRIYFLYSNPDGADIDVLQICNLYCEEGIANSKSGRRNAAVIEFPIGDEDVFFKKL